VKRILFIKLIEQGATVAAYSAIRRAVDLVGRENVFFCAFENNRAILDLLTLNSHWIEPPAGRATGHDEAPETQNPSPSLIPSENILCIRETSFPAFVCDVLRTVRVVRRARIDATVDMEFFARASVLLAFLTGARHRAGLHLFRSEGPYRGDLLTHRVQYNPYLNVAKAYLLLVETLVEDPTVRPMLKAPANRFGLLRPIFTCDAQEKAEMREMLYRALGGYRPAHLVVFNPNECDVVGLRKWPRERYIELAQRLLASHPDTAIVLTGTAKEVEAIERMRRAIDSPRVTSVAGKTNLRDLLVLYTVSDVLVTSDSGPGHFSSMTSIDSVILFGPETPRIFAPLGPNVHILYAELACSPCVNVYNNRFSPCSDSVCMQAIAVDEVVHEVEACLGHRTTPDRPSSTGLEA